VLFQVRRDAEALDSIATALPQIRRRACSPVNHIPIQQHRPSVASIFASIESPIVSGNLSRPIEVRLSIVALSIPLLAYQTLQCLGCGTVQLLQFAHFAAYLKSKNQAPCDVT
jgi:hypothetical protein